MPQRFFILGAGRFGTHLATRLSEFGCEVVVADRAADRVKDLSDDGFHAIEMDVEDEDALLDAGVVEADAVVVSIGENMQGSILATLALKQLKVRKIVARALDAKHAQVLQKVGADLVVLPTRDMAYRLAEQLRDNSLSERLPLSGDYLLARVILGAKLHGLTLVQAELPRLYKVNVVLILRPVAEGENKTIEPTANTTLELKDVAFLVGKRENINRFERDCGVN